MKPTVLIFAAIIILGSVYEVWGVWMESRDPRRRLSITHFVGGHPHLAIIIGGALFAAFGYALGSGGP